MILKPDILAAAIDGTPHAGPRLLMSPRGEPLTQALVAELAAGPGALIVCGRFEGVDQRVIDRRHLREISIGDYILSGGEPAALVLLDAIIRLLPGVMGKLESAAEESFSGGLLEHPHFTKPNRWEDEEIPAVLLSGDHKAIARTCGANSGTGKVDFSTESALEAPRNGFHLSWAPGKVF